MSAVKLTPKRESFAAALARGLTQAGAYRIAFPTSVGWKDATVHKRASELAADRDVLGRVAELQAAAAEANLVTLVQHVATLASLRDEARAVRQFGAAIQAETARGKASGLYSDKLHVTGDMSMSLTVAFETPRKPADGQ